MVFYETGMNGKKAYPLNKNTPGDTGGVDIKEV